jgi:hypothetical protein
VYWTVLLECSRRPSGNKTPLKQKMRNLRFGSRGLKSKKPVGKEQKNELKTAGRGKVRKGTKNIENDIGLVPIFDTTEPTPRPTKTPTEKPTEQPTEQLTREPTELPTMEEDDVVDIITEEPSDEPSVQVIQSITEAPTDLNDSDSWGRNLGAYGCTYIDPV